MCRVHSKIKPCSPGLIVAWNTILRIAGKVGHIEPLFWKFVDLSQKLPAESDGFFLGWEKDEENESDGKKKRALK